MLSSPLSITIAGTAHSLSKIREDQFSSLFRKKATGLEIDLNIRHTYEGKQVNGFQIERHNIDLTYTTFDAEGVPTVRQVYTVVRSPRGLDIATAVDSLLGLNVALAASSGALLTSIVSWES